jgi:hypothetical protein
LPHFLLFARQEANPTRFAFSRTSFAPQGVQVERVGKPAICRIPIHRLSLPTDLAFREPSLLFSPAKPEKSLGTNLKETRRAVATTTSTRLQDQQNPSGMRSLRRRTGMHRWPLLPNEETESLHPIAVA